MGKRCEPSFAASDGLIKQYSGTNRDCLNTLKSLVGIFSSYQVVTESFEGVSAALVVSSFAELLERGKGASSGFPNRESNITLTSAIPLTTRRALASLGAICDACFAGFLM
jgi:hypothetical protein